MCPSFEDKDGVTVDRFEDVFIPLPKGITKCSITISRGDSGTWYTAFSLHHNLGGHGYGPWPKFSKKYPSRDEAIVAGARLIKKSLDDTKDTKLIQGKIGQQLLDALDEVIVRHMVGMPAPIVQETFAFLLDMVPASPTKSVIKRIKPHGISVTQPSIFDAAPKAAEAVSTDLPRGDLLEELREKRRQLIEAKKSSPIRQSVSARVALYREFPDDRPTVKELKKQKFRDGEIKILRAGFTLANYSREEKKVKATCCDPRLGWYLVSIAPTYAAAERTLAELLEDKNTVQISEEGRTVGGASEKKLADAGFEFYRSEGVIPGHGIGPRIKSRSTNWGTYKKFQTRNELLAAWKELMKDEKTLES